MLIATDPLSLLFIFSFLFGLLFLIVTAFLGGIGQGHHVGGHHIHIGGHGAPHVHAHTSHAVHGHAGHTNASHAQAAHAQAAHNGQAGQKVGKPAPATAQAHVNILSYLGYINPLSLAIFLVGFGFFGYVFHNSTALALPLALALSGLSGLVIAIILLMTIDRLFGGYEGSTMQDVSDRTGLVGKVNITIPENGIGEILYVSPGGMRKSVPARTVDGRRLESNQEIVVVNYQAGVAEVDTWDRVISQGEPEDLDLPDEDELAQLRTLLNESPKAETEYVMRKDLQKE
ncbi:MAG TPA: hypothetical protein VKY19_12130 [Ktedonosporobacter sp.]|jgi:membrane protein implicated in regulation of membrane protease activity|nr:hypothetical protein [Ktedonosporobacter sp.]